MHDGHDRASGATGTGASSAGGYAAGAADQLRRHSAAEARDRAAERRDAVDEAADHGDGAHAQRRQQAAIDRLHAARDRDEDV